MITHKWGEEGRKYIKDLLTNLQGGKDVPSDTVSGLSDKILSNYIAAVFGFNPSIVFKQVGSIPLASAYLGARNAPTPAQLHRIDQDLINKYTSELAWRTMGYSSPETKFLKDNPNRTETNKVTRFAFGGGAITAMDGWAASTLWPWAENKVRREFPDLEVGSQEMIDAGKSPFYKKVAEEFNNAVSRSQSVSDETHQGTLRKSKKLATRALTMFKSDSAQGYNTLRQKIGEAQFYAKSGDKEAARKARCGVGVAFLSLIGGYAWAELIEFLMNLWKRKGSRYRDDEDELTLQSIGKEVGMGLLGDMAGVVVYGEEVCELIGNWITGNPWYGIDTPGLEQVQDMIEAVQKSWDGASEFISGAANVANEGGDLPKYLGTHWQDLAGAVKDAAFTCLTYFAKFPASNMEAYIMGTLQWARPEAKAAYDNLWKSAKKKDLIELSGRELASQVDIILSGRMEDVSEDTAAEVAELYEAGYSGVIPTDVPSKISVEGEERELSASQKLTYADVWRENTGDALGEVMGQDWYKNLDQESRAKVLGKLYDYAAQKAKAALFDDFAPGKFVEDFDALRKEGLDLADCLEVWQTGKNDADGDGAVKSAERFDAINNSGMSEKEKVAAIGSILGTNMTTESGGKSQYALLLEATDAGFSVGDWLELKKAGCMTEGGFEKARIGKQYGISAKQYVKLKDMLKLADEQNEDPEKRNGTVDASEAAFALNRMMGLSHQQKAALWQMQNKGWKPERNPFDKKVGKKVYQIMNRE